MLKTRKDLAPESVIAKVTFGRQNQKRFITVHNTGNVRVGANAEMHSRLQKNGNSRAASWHWQVKKFA